jgi:quinol monooxygenase YgiN
VLSRQIEQAGASTPPTADAEGNHTGKGQNCEIPGSDRGAGFAFGQRRISAHGLRNPAGAADTLAIQAKEADMLTISAIIRVRKGCEPGMAQALLEVAKHVRDNEAATIGFFVSQDAKDPCVFTTYERFVDRAAMDAHNNSNAVARFFGIAKPMLDGDVTLVTCHELSAKPLDASERR